MGLWATGMDRYDQMLLLVNRWVTQIDLVASEGHLRGGVLIRMCPTQRAELIAVRSVPVRLNLVSASTRPSGIFQILRIFVTTTPPLR